MQKHAQSVDEINQDVKVIRFLFIQIASECLTVLSRFYTLFTSKKGSNVTIDAMVIRGSGRKIIFNTFLIFVIGTTSFFVYQEYGKNVIPFFKTDASMFTVYVNSVALSVSVADSYEERVQGLSGVKELSNLEGKLFIFDDEDKYGIWMKDMQFPIDIMWFDNNLELVHIEKNIDPSTYPTVFTPRKDARFVLETNANIVNSFNLKVGDSLTLPPIIIPRDISKNLQE